LSERFRTKIDGCPWAVVHGEEEESSEVAIAAVRDYRKRVPGPPAILNVKVWDRRSSPTISEWKITCFTRFEAERVVL